MPSEARPIRWGILGTGWIVTDGFLPALREAGDGVAEVVGSRDADRAGAFAARHGIAGGVSGYRRVLEDPNVDAVYVALPNSIHTEWTIAAMRAGKAVLCEKPLCASVPETELVLGEAEATGALLWEAFVFPLQEQMDRVLDLLGAGAIGEPRERSTRPSTSCWTNPTTSGSRRSSPAER